MTLWRRRRRCQEDMRGSSGGARGSHFVGRALSDNVGRLVSIFGRSPQGSRGLVSLLSFLKN